MVLVYMCISITCVCIDIISISVFVYYCTSFVSIKLFVNDNERKLTAVTAVANDMWHVYVWQWLWPV